MDHCRPIHDEEIPIEITAALKQELSRIIFVSPFIHPDLKLLNFRDPWHSMLLNHLSGGAEVSLFTMPPNLRRQSPKHFIEKLHFLDHLNLGLGIDVRVSPVHAKVYFFRLRDGTDEVIVGSANLTTPSMKQLTHEMAFISNEAQVCDQVLRIITRWENDSQRTYSLISWKHKEERQIQEAKRRLQRGE